MFFILLAFIAAFIAFDYYIIEKKKIEIKNLGHFVRGAIHVAVIGLLGHLDPHIYATLTFGVTYWFLFDTGLNVARKRPLYHLGSGFLDTLQKKYPNEGVWFAWKLILMIGLVASHFGN